MKYLCLVLVVSLFIGVVYSQQEEQRERQRQRCRPGSTAPAQRCNEYWRCVNGYWRIVYCPYRQVYDQYRRRCNYPWNVRGRCGRLQGENEHEVASAEVAGAAKVHALPLAEQEKKSQEAHSP